MAEKKERKYVATENAGKAAVKTTKEERRQKATGKRVAAVIFWLLAIAMEVVFILILNKTIWFPLLAENYWLVSFRFSICYYRITILEEGK